MFLEGGQFGQIVIDDVGVVHMILQVLLVVAFGGEKAFQRDYLGRDRFVEDLGVVQLLDVGIGDLFLLVVVVENCRAVLGAGVGSLTVHLGGIVGDREVDFQQLPIGNL